MGEKGAPLAKEGFFAALKNDDVKQTTATATAKTEADPYGMTNKKATATEEQKQVQELAGKVCTFPP